MRFFFPFNQNPNKLLTYHLLQQLAVSLSKEHTQIENFGNVKQEVIIDDFSKHSWGDEIFL